jgi:hypothetical protein
MKASRRSESPSLSSISTTVTKGAAKNEILENDRSKRHWLVRCYFADRSSLVARSAETKQTNSGSPVVDPRGSLHVPEGYRTSYQFLGSWALPADAGKSTKEIHNGYASPGAIEAYRKTGHFPEAAVLVKERFHTATQQMTPGTVSHAEKLVGWFGINERRPRWGEVCTLARRIWDARRRNTGLIPKCSGSSAMESA